MLEAVLLEQTQRASIVETRPAPAYITVAPAWARPVTPGCVVAESNRQSLELLKVLSVMKAEGGRVGQFVQNTNGSYDIGPMQINTIHLPYLSKTFGISSPAIAQLLAYDGCFNVAVGAWLLRQRTNEVNGDFWYGVGRYHSKTPYESTRYILRVYSVMQGLVTSDSNARVQEMRSMNQAVNRAAQVAYKGD